MENGKTIALEDIARDSGNPEDYAKWLVAVWPDLALDIAKQKFDWHSQVLQAVELILLGLTGHIFGEPETLIVK